jgi:hypothetical protein
MRCHWRDQKETGLREQKFPLKHNALIFGDFRLPNRAGRLSIFPAMEFAGPRTGEPPDDFRADDSC